MATVPNTPEPRRSSIRLPRPLWIGLATVALVVVAVGLGFGVPIYRQQVAIREIDRFGGWVAREPGGPDWLRRWTGSENIFDEVQGVYLVGTNLADADLDRLNGAVNPKILAISGTRVGDAGLIHLTNFTSVEALALDHSDVTDAGLKHLHRLKNLRFVDLRSTWVTDTGVAELMRALPGLKVKR